MFRGSSSCVCLLNPKLIKDPAGLCIYLRDCSSGVPWLFIVCSSVCSKRYSYVSVVNFACACVWAGSCGAIKDRREIKACKELKNCEEVKSLFLRRGWGVIVQASKF